MKAAHSKAPLELKAHIAMFESYVKAAHSKAIPNNMPINNSLRAM